MGTDIHFYVEIYDRDLKKWYSADLWEQNLNSDDEVDDEIDELQMVQSYHKCLYTGRNYDVFAILANVRNGYGFAGVRTGDGFNFISKPKGLPNDCSILVRKAYEKYSDSYHDPSYLTLKELEDFNWKQIAKHRGIVDHKGYEEFKQIGIPSYYCGGVAGINVRHVDNETMEKLISKNDIDENVYTTVEWTQTYEESCDDFMQVIPELKKLAGLKSASEIRIVFWFDS